MIGVFDSGNGGLTVLSALLKRLPDQAFVYLGDHANAPYGGRSAEQIFALTVAGVERLFGFGCRLVLLACNTAAAVALRRLQQQWLGAAYPEHRVLGVFVPMVEAVTRLPWQVERPLPGGEARPLAVGVFATRRTVASGAYPFEIGRRAPAVAVVQQACPELVSKIEAGAPRQVLEEMVARTAAELCDRIEGGRPDAVILGCTHYPLVAPAFARALPEGVEIFDQPALVAESLADYLRRHPEFGAPLTRPERLCLLTTGDSTQVSAVARRFFAGDVGFDQVE